VLLQSHKKLVLRRLYTPLTLLTTQHHITVPSAGTLTNDDMVLEDKVLIEEQ